MHHSVTSLVIDHWSLRSHMRKPANQKDQFCKILCGVETDRARVTLSELNSTSSTVTQELNIAQNEISERDALSEERSSVTCWDNEQDESSNADSTTALMAMMASMNENMTTVLKHLARVEGNAGKPPKQRRIVETTEHEGNRFSDGEI